MFSFPGARGLIRAAASACGKLGKNPVLKIVIAAYVMLITGLILLYTGAWVYQFRHDAATLADLLAIIDKVTDANALALITFIGGCLIDLNGNGVPDALETQIQQQKEGVNNDI